MTSTLPDPQAALNAAAAAPARAERMLDAMRAGAQMNRDEIRQAAEEFESLFISQFMSTMFEGVETDGPFGGGNAEMLFRASLIEEYSKAMSARGGFGIADRVQAELIKIQEQALRPNESMESK